MQWAARPSGSHRVDVEPVGPVSAHVKEVVEVDQAQILQFRHEVAERVFDDNWTYHYKVAFDAELVGGEPEPFVEERTCESALFECDASDQ